jgi:hypothetical protein
LESTVDTKTLLEQFKAADPKQDAAWRGLIAKAIAHIVDYHPKHLGEFKAMHKIPTVDHPSEYERVKAEICGYLEALADD